MASTLDRAAPPRPRPTLARRTASHRAPTAVGSDPPRRATMPSNGPPTASRRHAPAATAASTAREPRDRRHREPRHERRPSAAREPAADREPRQPQRARHPASSASPRRPRPTTADEPRPPRRRPRRARSRRRTPRSARRRPVCASSRSSTASTRSSRSSTSHPPNGSHASTTPTTRSSRCSTAPGSCLPSLIGRAVAARQGTQDRPPPPQQALRARPASPAPPSASASAPAPTAASRRCTPSPATASRSPSSAPRPPSTRSASGAPIEQRRAGTLPHNLHALSWAIELHRVVGELATDYWRTPRYATGRYPVPQIGNGHKRHPITAAELDVPDGHAYLDLPPFREIKPDVSLELRIPSLRLTFDLLVELDLTGRPSYNHDKLRAYDAFLTGWALAHPRYRALGTRPVAVFVCRDHRSALACAQEADRLLTGRIGAMGTAAHDWYYAGRRAPLLRRRARHLPRLAPSVRPAPVAAKRTSQPARRKPARDPHRRTSADDRSPSVSRDRLTAPAPHERTPGASVCPVLRSKEIPLTTRPDVGN